jgi:hypothetical protein
MPEGNQAHEQLGEAGLACGSVDCAAHGVERK